MTTLLARLRDALRPDYEVERELATGGMGTVFLARDAVLDRAVAVKILRPELATAEATERFLREARLLANLTHPHVVPVHRAGEQDGLCFYVMDYVPGETLANRLRAGPLARDEALKLARDLLDALEAAHRLGVIHRDVKPANVFFVEGRALLADFGIAKVAGVETHSTGDRSPGTPGYLAPEQAFGWGVTPRTDLYTAGMVIYEAFTGRRWVAVLPDQKPDWSGVPRRLVPILRRALAWDPEARWPDARAFRQALWRTRTRKYRRRTVLLTIGGLVVGGLVAWLVLPPRPPSWDVAVLPFGAAPRDSTLAQNLATLTRFNLEPFLRRVELKLASVGDVDEWWAACRAPPDRLTDACIRRARARFLAHGMLTSVNGAPVVQLELISDGRREPGGSVPLSELSSAAHRLGYLIARDVAPGREGEYPDSTVVSDSDPALIAFLDGLRAFKRNAFGSASEHFRDALRIDPDFALAAWWHFNAWRWTVTGEPVNREVELARVLAEQGAGLPRLDSLLMAAQLAPDQRTRLTIYRAAIDTFPRDGYAAFLYAEELQTRGPHAGIPLATSTAELENALRKDSAFAPTLYHLVWAAIRQGRPGDAERLLTRFEAVSAGRDEVEYYQPPLLRFAIVERFDPGRAPAVRDAIFGEPQDAAALGDVFRLAAMLGLHRTVAEVGERMASVPGLDARARGNAYEAQGLGRFALGQVGRALVQFDSAAAFLGWAAALEAAEWRVLGRALGIRGIAAAPRAAWALGMDGVARGDPAALARWREALRRLEPDSAALRLGHLLDAWSEAARGAYDRALAISDQLLPSDSGGRGGDPFARAALHLGRAAWLDSLSQPAAADSARLWYEHFEFVRIPSGPAHPGEIDWALSPYVMWLRGEQAAALGRRADACRHFRRVVELWTDADPALGSLVQQAGEYMRRSCRP